MPIKKEIVKPIDLLCDFKAFVALFYEISHGHEWQWAITDLPFDYLKEACDNLMQVFTGKLTRLIIAWPPRHHKTTLLGLFICYYYAVNPKANIMYLSAVSVNISKMVLLVRSVLDSKEYIHLFGKRIGKSIGINNGFHIENPNIKGKGGLFYALSFYGPITGEGAGWKTDGPGGLIIIDDPLKVQDSDSTIFRNKCINIFNRTIKSRLNDPKRTPIIVCAQRVSEYDLIGYLILTQQSEWYLHILPAEIDGKALNRNCIDEVDLAKIKKFDNYVYYTQYLQSPAQADHFLFKNYDFRILREMPEILMTFVTVDTGESSKQSAANTVFSLFGVFKVKSDIEFNNPYRLLWIDALSIKTEPAELEMACVHFLLKHRQYAIHHIAIEKKSTGVYLLSLLEKNYKHLDIRPILRSDHRSKTRRLIDVQGLVRRGMVHFMEDAPHYHLCLANLTQITRMHDNKNVDEADTMCDALSYVYLSESFEQDLNNYSSLSTLFSDNLTDQFNRINLDKKQQMLALLRN